MDSQTVPQLKAIAKNLGLRGYSRLRKADLINFINQNLPRVVVKFIDDDNSTSLTKVGGVSGYILDEPIPKNEIPRGQTILKPTPVRQRVGHILDKPIPKNEIPRGQTILKPTPVRQIKAKIDDAVEWGKKEVENWGEWLKKVSAVPRIVVNDEIDSFRKRINELYKSKQYEIVKIGESSNNKFKTFFDKFKIEPNQ